MPSALRYALLAPALLYFLGQDADAQETVPLDRAREFARHLVESAKSISGTAVEIDADVLHPVGIRAGESGGLVVPDRNLTAGALEKAGTTPIPVGELFLRNVALSVDGKPVEKEKLLHISVSMEDRKVEVPIYLLAAAKDAEGSLQLLIFGKGSEPIARTRLGKVSSKAKMPIELSAEKQGENSGLLTLNVVGQYEAELSLQKTTDQP